MTRIWPSCRHPLNYLRRSFSASSRSWQWQRLKSLDGASVEPFRQDCFLPEKPALIPGAFQNLPAVTKWFSTSDAAISELLPEFFHPYRDTVLPMELTQKATHGVSFSKANLPLEFFLSWGNKTNGQGFCHLYIAQAPLTSLPEDLRNDLPTPEIVSKAGRGDVYDANLWMGLSPTYTPLHRDPNPNLLVQLAGRKTVRLMPPEAGKAVFSDVQQSLGGHASASFRGNEMMQGQERQLLESRIWGNPSEMDISDSASCLEAELARGDGIFIPKGWWHSVRGTGSGFTASVNWWFR